MNEKHIRSDFYHEYQNSYDDIRKCIITSEKKLTRDKLETQYSKF